MYVQIPYFTTLLFSIDPPELAAPALDPDPASLLLLAQTASAALSAPFVAACVLALVALLVMSAIFSGSEVALFSLAGSAKASLAESGDRTARRVLKLLEQPRRLLITILLLNTATNVAAAIVAALLTARVAEAMGWSWAVTVVLEVVALTFVILVMSEITPKLLAVRHAETFSRMVSGPLATLHRILYPLSGFLARSTRFMRERIETESERISPEDLKTLADVGEAHGTLEEEEKEMIYSIVEFGETSVREIMVSRLDVVALPVTAGVEDALTLIRETGHSRIPLYADHLDNILGVVYAKDLLPYLLSANGNTSLDWRQVARPAIFVPPGKKLDDLLKDLQAKKTHMAVVVDEYGGTAGLVTLEDILEEIVGEIRDEHDESEEQLYERLDDATFLFDARIDLDDVNELLNASLDTEGYDFETLGGLIFHETGTIPEEGHRLNIDDLAMRVVTVENNRIGRVHVRRVLPASKQENNNRTPGDPP